MQWQQLTTAVLIWWLKRGTRALTSKGPFLGIPKSQRTKHQTRITHASYTPPQLLRALFPYTIGGCARLAVPTCAGRLPRPPLPQSYGWGLGWGHPGLDCLGYDLGQCVPVGRGVGLPSPGHLVPSHLGSLAPSAPSDPSPGNIPNCIYHSAHLLLSSLIVRAVCIHI